MIAEKYKLVLKDIITELSYTQDILEKTTSETYYDDVNTIISQYEELFSENHERHKKLISDHIEFKIGAVGISTAFRTSEHRMSRHITLQMTSVVSG